MTLIDIRPSRRAFSRLLLAGAAAPLMAGAVRAADKPKTKVALLVPGLTNDGSFNQIALEAIKKIADAGLITYDLRERMADPSASEPVIRQYAARGTELIIGHGIELSQVMLKVAAEFPAVGFVVSGGQDIVNKTTKNVDTWTSDFAQAGYLYGWATGKLLGVTSVGMVGGPQLPFVVQKQKGFRVGLAETNPNAKVVEVYTGSFDDAQKSAEATRGMISQGVQVVFSSGDGIGNGVAAAAAAGNIYTVGITGSAGGLAKKVNIITANTDMFPIYDSFVRDFRDDKFGNRFMITGLANKTLVLADVNEVGPIVPKDLAAQVQKLADDLSSGAKKLPDFK